MQYSSRSENYSSSLRDSPPKWTSGKDHKTGYSYKTSAAYQYSNTGSGSGSYQQDKPIDKNIDQLDALLEDLKNEREITRDRDHSMNYRTIERSTNEDPLTGTVTKTTKVIKTSKNISGGLADDSELYPTSDYSTLRSNGTLVRNDYQTLEKPYVGSNLSPGGGFYETKHQTKIYESNRSLNKPEFVPTANSTVVSNTQTNATLLQEDLKNLTVSEDILPVPGTKVTTTVRTYTYEIPANAPLPTSNTLSRKIQYNTIQTNETNNVVQPHPVHAIPQTVVYNTESYSTLNKDNKPVVSNVNYEVREHYETNTLRNNTLPLQPRNHQHPVSPGPLGPTSGEPPVGSNTIVYNIHNTTTTTNTERPGYPGHSPNNQGPRSPVSPQHGPGPHHGPGGPTTHHYIYKESTNTVNTIHGGPPHEPNKPHGGYPPNGSTGGYPPTNGGPGYPGNGHPPHTNITYNYSSTTTNTSNTRGGPNYGSPSTPLPPAPFPVDGVVEYPTTNGNPPQRVEELMQSLGNTDSVDRPDLNTPRKREIETAVATPNQQQIPSVNRAGREIYYPPGHEMMLTKRSEMHASGSQAGGRWAKGSGMYEYESGSRSKTTTKSGGAMVPVCLPLCCAMPCSIM
ncbi:uncharacterized protein LOC133327541 [Musca vetustissima]|uniref:uncharacterized protein LOC133327541 n=1 Tax=Musca vetustissima TaxID=27455 RepID=UPI002AB715A1|nr:uncharacterized protein LOC133327541 [Musca vetustissima]